MAGRDYGIRYDRGRGLQGFQHVWQIATAFAEIALRRRGPESLPDSGFLVVLALLIDLAVYLVELGFYGGVSRLNLMLFAVDAVLMFTFVYAVLAFFRLERRFRQTVTAMLAADIVITLGFLPIAALAVLTGQDLQQAGPFLLLSLGFEFWLIYVCATILARSLSQPLIVGLGFEILSICLALFIISTLATDVSALNTASG